MAHDEIDTESICVQVEQLLGMGLEFATVDVNGVHIEVRHLPDGKTQIKLVSTCGMEFHYEADDDGILDLQRTRRD